jgi:hypothetical protein
VTKEFSLLALEVTTHDEQVAYIEYGRSKSIAVHSRVQGSAVRADSACDSRRSGLE